MGNPMKQQDQPERTTDETRVQTTDSQDIDRTVDAEQQEMTELPDREAMSLVNANLAAPINAAVALNALSDGSTAVAQASQTAPITQGIG
jgi:hypothetical protein